MDKLSRFYQKPLRQKSLAVLANFRQLAKTTKRSDPAQRLILNQLQEINTAVTRSYWLAKERYLQHEFSSNRYSDGKRLEQYGFKIYSQNDEDGIIQEIFHRIGTRSRRFIEFGVENGLENITLKLLREGWYGLWIEGSAKDVESIKSQFADTILDNQLSVRQAFITAENINGLIGDYGREEIDLLSIDIDGNDFYVWQAINKITPRVVVIEFNNKFGGLSLCVRGRYW